jgi:hypothetical protein
MLRASLLLRNRFLKVLLIVAVLLSSVLTAFAARLICRSDPVVILSNGMVMDISADIGTLLFNVQEVHYTLNVPEGVSAVLIIRTPTWLTSRETFTVIDNQPAGQYETSTIAYTRAGNASVTLNALLLSVNGLRLDYHSANGVERQTITLDLSE